MQQRRGRYPGGPEPPFVPGLEAAGSIDAVGDGVDREVGERVVTMLRGGGYAGYVTAPAFGLFDVPAFMDFEAAGGVGSAAVQLADAADAHEFVEGRENLGKVVLVP